MTPMMKSALIAFTVCTLSGAPARAQSDASPMPTPARYDIGAKASYEEAVQRLAAQGFQLVGYELDDRRIEVKGLTATGHCLELKFNAATGKEVRRKRDNDCGVSR